MDLAGSFPSLIALCFFVHHIKEVLEEAEQGSGPGQQRTKDVTRSNCHDAELAGGFQIHLHPRSTWPLAQAESSRGHTRTSTVTVRKSRLSTDTHQRGVIFCTLSSPSG